MRIGAFGVGGPLVRGAVCGSETSGPGDISAFVSGCGNSCLNASAFVSGCDDFCFFAEGV